MWYDDLGREMKRSLDRRGKQLAFAAVLLGVLPVGVPMQKPLKMSAEGRKCRFPGCERTLSIYNHEAYCHKHQDQMAEEEKRKTLPYFGRFIDNMEPI
jgi:hypothetical protein